MSELPEPLCDRHDDAMTRTPAGDFACHIGKCQRHFSPTAGYATAGDDASEPNRHPCPACGGAMHITRFTAHGPAWLCTRCAS